MAFNVAVIGFFKYEGFLADNLNALASAAAGCAVAPVPNLELALPIGISFYTLQALSCVIDIYHGDVPPQRNILHLGMYYVGLLRSGHMGHSSLHHRLHKDIGSDRLRGPLGELSGGF